MREKTISRTTMGKKLYLIYERLCGLKIVKHLRKNEKKILVVCKGIGFIFFILIALLYLMPLVVTLTNSFMDASEVKRHYSTLADGFVQMNIIPDRVKLSQYYDLLFDSPVYLSMFWNSVKIVFPIVILQIVVSVPAAYTFTILKFRGKEVLFFLYIIVMLLPTQVTLLPNYIVADWLNITDSYLAIILPGIFNPFGVFLLRQYLKSMPDGYIEAAKLDGAGHGRILISIIMPLMKSGIAGAGMLALIDYWNLVDQAVVFTTESRKQPLSLFLASISENDAGVVFAGSVFYAIPVLLVLLYGQEYLKKGIGVTGLRG